MKLYYLSSTGTKIDLNSSRIWSNEPEALLESEWKYTTNTTYAATAQLQSMYKESKEHSLEISILAETKTEYESLMEELETAFEYDAVNMTPGKLYWNGSYRNVLVIKRKYAEYCEWADTIDATLTFLSLNPSWIEEIKVSVRPTMAGSEVQLPVEIPFTIPVTQKNTGFKIDHYTESDFKLIAYGPTTSIYITISGHIYEVNHAIETGQYLTIDSRATAPIEKRCFLTKADGSTENCFNDRGSESIFTKIQPGANLISYSCEYGVDLTIYKERSDPRWS